MIFATDPRFWVLDSRLAHPHEEKPQITQMDADSIEDLSLFPAAVPDSCHRQLQPVAGLCR